MTGASFFYKLISTQSQGSGGIINSTTTTTTTNHTFASLLSGTSYNISITTVGPADLESEAVHRYWVTTSKSFYSCTCTTNLSNLWLSGVTFAPFKCLETNRTIKCGVTCGAKDRGEEHDSHVAKTWWSQGRLSLHCDMARPKWAQQWHNSQNWVYYR